MLIHILCLVNDRYNETEYFFKVFVDIWKRMHYFRNSSTILTSKKKVVFRKISALKLAFWPIQNIKGEISSKFSRKKINICANSNTIWPHS